MSTYAFDAKLCAVVRVQADSETAARELVADIQGVDVNAYVDGATITEISSCGPLSLFEIDGELQEDTPSVCG